MVNHKTPKKDKVNDCFAKIGRTVSDRIQQASETFSVEKIVGSMPLFPTNCDEIANILSHMKHKKSFGNDGICNESFICCSPFLEPYFALAINKFFEKIFLHNASKLKKNLTIIQKRKLLKVYKKGNYLNCRNYRPISLLNCFSKVFENVLYIKMFNFL